MARRTQEQRSTATRGRILDAAVECLASIGYAATSTTRICAEAGVSRGAMLHHFPSKHALMRAVLEHVLELRLAEFREAIRDIPEGPQRLVAVIEATWRGISNETSFIPWIELVVASRSDPELQAIVRASAEQTQRASEAMFREVFGVTEQEPTMAELAPTFAFALMNGLALRRLVMADDGADRVLELVKQLSPLLHLAVPMWPRGG